VIGEQEEITFEGLENEIGINDAGSEKRLIRRLCFHESHQSCSQGPIGIKNQNQSVPKRIHLGGSNKYVRHNDSLLILQVSLVKCTLYIISLASCEHLHCAFLISLPE